MQKFEKSMERLRKLDMAAGYVELLKEVDNLRYVDCHVVVQDIRWKLILREQIRMRRTTGQV